MDKEDKSMDFEQLCGLMFEHLVPRLENSPALRIFAAERAKFEGWLKVELCNVLVEQSVRNLVPEKDRIDVTFDGWAIKLKTVNTSYRYPNVANKTCPITMNIQGVIDDIEQLQRTSLPTSTHKAILFVVFPVMHDKPEWQNHLHRIVTCVGASIRHREFTFQNGVPGVMYCGLL